MVAWTLTAAGTFWIRGNNPETWRSRALFQLQHQLPDDALNSADQALRLDTNDANSHCLKAEVLVQLNRPAEAAPEFAEALRLCPDFPQAINNYAALLVTGDKDDQARAVKLAEHGCELTGYQQADSVTVLAGAYAAAGDRQTAVVTAQKALMLADRDGEKELVQQNQDLIERNR